MQEPVSNPTPASERPWLDRARRKRKIRLTPRMVKYAEARAQGKRPLIAAKDAGYANPSCMATWLESSNSMIQANREILAEGGVGQSDIVRTLKEGLAAEKSVYVLIKDERDFEHPEDTKEGQEERRKRDREPKKTLIKEEDWHARHKFVESVISMAGMRPEVQQKLIIEGQVNVDVTHHVQPAVSEEMMSAWETLTPEQKMKAITERSRRLLTGTLRETPVDLSVVSPAVAALPPSNDTDDDTKD